MVDRDNARPIIVTAMCRLQPPSTAVGKRSGTTPATRPIGLASKPCGADFLLAITKARGYIYRSFPVVPPRGRESRVARTH
ncbi:MAG: hypothetical protein WBO50_17705, partial [Nitrospira sp.]